MSLVCAACALAGAAAGAATALGAFWYDGSGRVNVLLLLALFVGLPLLTLVLFAAAALSRRGLRAINAGRLGTLLARMLPAGGARALARVAAGEHGAGPAKWSVLCWSQWLGLGYGAGAVAAALALVLFTDLAFGWATTLDVDPGAVQRLASALALLTPGRFVESSDGDVVLFVREGSPDRTQFNDVFMHPLPLLEDAALFFI